MERSLLLLAVLYCCIWSTYTHPCPTRKHVENEFDAMASLQRLGYLVVPPADIAELSDVTWSVALATFQRMAAIKVTGKLDSPTMEMLNKPRCGVRDIMEDQRREVFGDRVNRKRRFAVSEEKWLKTELTYRITQYTPDLSESTVNSIIAQAFRKWSAVTPLTFILQPRGLVDLEIRFVSQRHGDSAPFDGPGGTLAHAYFPPVSSSSPALAGDTHFDEAETWIEINSDTPGTPLLCVAIHEIGHSLGVRHSDDEGAIMWPWAGECTEDTDLGQDDIDAIQHLYGSREEDETSTPATTAETTVPATTITTTTTAAATTTAETTTSSPAITTDVQTTLAMTSPEFVTSEGRSCDGSLDAITMAGDGFLYGFRGNQVFRFSEGVEEGFPRIVSDVFPGSPTNISAAMTSYKHQGRKGRRGHGHQHHGHQQHGHHGDRKPAYTYLFSANRVWKYKYDRRQGFRLARRSPEFTSRVFRGVAASIIDAAMVSAENGDVYLFSGDQYWRHKGDGKKLAARTYPRPWGDHPVYSKLPSIDAALFYKDSNYFYLGQYFTWYDRVNRRMLPSRLTSHFLFWCPQREGDFGDNEE